MNDCRMQPPKPVGQSHDEGHFRPVHFGVCHHAVYLVVPSQHWRCRWLARLRARLNDLRGNGLFLFVFLVGGCRRGQANEQYRHSQQDSDRSENASDRHHFSPSADDQWMWTIFHTPPARRSTIVSVVTRSIAFSLKVPVVRPSVASHATGPTASPARLVTVPGTAWAKAESAL